MVENWGELLGNMRFQGGLRMMFMRLGLGSWGN